MDISQIDEQHMNEKINLIVEQDKLTRFLREEFCEEIDKGLEESIVNLAIRLLTAHKREML